MSDYLYSSARVRALENSLLGREDLAHLAECATVESIVASLEEYGWEIIRDKDGVCEREKTLLHRLEQAHCEISELTEGEATRLFALWRYPADCNNLKAAIKCFFRKIDPTHLMLDYGTVDAETVVRAVTEGNPSALPDFLAEAAREAMEDYAKNKNPQVIDLTIDKACYRAMLKAAEESRSSYAIELIRTRIDLINLVMCVRVKRMASGAMERALLEQSLLDGGVIAHGDMMELYDTEETALWERLLYSDYKRFAEAMSSPAPSLTEVERAADNAWLTRVREAKFVPFGPEVLIGYLLAVENDVRNLRMIMAGRVSGLSVERIMERIRESYV